ncbi:hypothetical protein CAC42_491 [Sphaceloma murrayae]|uniref:Uncharacterized protein n=1 Tax=Sphaceloma murrayae TaxID=2082308 RepID=A0A2K1R3Y0_9PEZI|nr:hypothetical protein CAC42_491 [Sphaceloma murrayae]
MSTVFETERSGLLEASNLVTDDPGTAPAIPTGDSYQDAPEGQLLPPANFRPFFTLVEDGNTGEHYHPEVHYVFSDDDPDTLTSSIIDNLQPDSEDANHRLVLIDIGPDGRTIKSANSLSSNWQVSHTTIIPAPSWTETGPEATTEGLMLKVEGAQARLVAPKEKNLEELDDVVQRLEADIEVYTERLQHLQEVMAKSSML